MALYETSGRREPGCATEEELPEELEPEAFGELFRYTLVGLVLGTGVGWLCDRLGYRTHGLAQWLVRTLAGESESLFEGLYALRARLAGRTATLAEAYGWGKLLGVAFPWAVDAGSRLVGIDLLGVEGFYLAYFYALSDQIGANVVGLLYLRRRSPDWWTTWRRYFSNPVMLASLAVILLVPVALLAARLLGFVPATQVRVAVETAAANLCWVPPLVGSIAERRARR